MKDQKEKSSHTKQPDKTSATFTIDPTQIPRSKDYTTKITLKDDTTKDKKTTRIRIYIDNDQDGIPDDLGLLHILPDDDHDQIPSAFEPILGIDPEDPDTDHDGLIDGEEYFGWETEITTNAGREKIWVYSNPNNTDTDGDGLDDLTEKQLGTSPISKDTDMDGLQDQMEIALNTTPTDWDTDNDGLPDGNETTLGTDPLSTDTDADGIPDYEEIYKHGTDPTCNDTDGDGLGDGEETFTVTYSLDEKCNFSWPKTFSIYVPVEYSQSTTITIGLGDVEKGTTIRAEIRHNGEKIWSTEEEAERPYTWTKTINITGGYVKGTWTLAIAPWPPERILLDKYTIEITARADPLKNDTDGDGILDGEEVEGVWIGPTRIWTNPILADTDMDGLTDYREIYELGTNPQNPDTDADGVRDGQDKAPKGNLMLEVRIGRVELELYKKYVWSCLLYTSPSPRDRG